MYIGMDDLVNWLYDHKGYKKGASKRIAQDVFEGLSALLVENGKIVIRGFGTFEVKDCAAHPAVLVGTAEKIMVPGYKTVTFRIGDDLQRRVKDSPSQA